MNTLKWKTNMVLITGAILLVMLAGCQSRFGEQAAGGVVAEKKLSCTLEKYEEPNTPVEIPDPKLGTTVRGQFSRWVFNCGDEYIDGNWIALQDIYQQDMAKDNDRSIGYIKESRGLSEGATSEGGAWRGFGQIFEEGALSGSYVGEGEFAGLMLYLIYDDAAQKLEYRVVKPSGEIPDAETYIQEKLGLSNATAEGEALTAKTDVNCPTSEWGFFNEGYEVVAQIPGSGIMTREAALTVYNPGKDSYLGGQVIVAYDFLTPEDQSINDLTSGYFELVTKEGGVWKGMEQCQAPTCQGVFVGEGKYEGLMMKYEMNFDTNRCKYRITELPE